MQERIEVKEFSFVSTAQMKKLEEKLKKFSDLASAMEDVSDMFPRDVFTEIDVFSGWFVEDGRVFVRVRDLEDDHVFKMELKPDTWAIASPFDGARFQDNPGLADIAIKTAEALEAISAEFRKFAHDVLTPTTQNTPGVNRG